MMPFLSRQTPLPFNKTASDCRNALDNQTKISFRVYEGEAVLTKDCTLVGEFAIIDVVPGKRGTQKFDLTFALDDNGVLSASALNKCTNDPHSVFITESCVQNVDQSFRASVYLSPTTLLPNGSSGMSRDRVTSWISLSNYMNELVSSANQKSLEGTLTDSQKHMLDLAISKEVAWLQQNRTQMDQDEIKRRHESWKLLVDRLRL
jgi:molecular chaperone DnaK (HSP70)